MVQIKARLVRGVSGTPLPNTPTTGNPFRYRGPKGPEDQEARELVAKYQEIKAKAATTS